MCAFASTAAAPQPLRVLFIGNSYIYFNNLPEVFRKLAESGTASRVEVRMVTPGGFRLKDHWEKKDNALETLRQGNWNYVVLQDQSTLGITYYVEGTPRVAGDTVFAPYAEKWADEIHKSGATPVFFLTWAGKNAPDDQPALNYAYDHAARATQSRLAPVGVAWGRIRRQHAAIDLFYAGHGSHPSPAGTYLAACTLYSTIFGKNPADLPAKIEGNPVNLETEQVEPDKTALLIDLPMDIASVLQAAAWQSVEELRRNGGYLKAPAVPAPALPPLPTARLINSKTLAGTWTGKMLFYPSGPVAMTLQFPDLGEGRPHLVIKYGSGDLADESLDLTDLRIAGREFTFSDPKSSGVGNLQINFRGILAEDGKLHGTAEAIRHEQDPPPKLVGDWLLEKP